MSNSNKNKKRVRKYIYVKEQAKKQQPVRLDVVLALALSNLPKFDDNGNMI